MFRASLLLWGVLLLMISGALGVARREPARSGHWLAYTLYEYDRGSIWVMRPEAPRSARALVKNLEDNLYPTWSPDGRCLIYTRYSDNTGNLFKQCLAGGPAQALTAYEVGLETLPDWSPDGQQVLYVSDEGGGTEIWLMAPDGSGARTLFSEVRYAWRPRWSFDGQWVYFASIPQNDLYRVRPDGSDLMRLPPCRT